MTKSIFLDTGFLIALESSNDQNHKKSKLLWAEVSNDLPLLITTDFIFDEVVTFFNSKGFHKKALELGTFLLDSNYVDIIRIDREIFSESWNYFQKNNDKLYSFTDCTSFIVMNKLKLKTALSFDRHFIQAGFKVLPDK